MLSSIPKGALAQSLGVALLCVGLFSAVRSRDIAYGINFDVISTDTSLIPNCASDQSATVNQKAFITRYATVQKSVQAELNAMRSSGFTAVRSIVQLYPGDHWSGDLTNTARIDESVLAAISDYARDVRDAGFSELIIAFGAQGTANPSCRKTDWGDCFDPATVSASVNAEAKIARAAQSVTGITLRVDLLNEACISDISSPRMVANFTAFISAASTMHAAAYPMIPATVSCQIERTGSGLVATKRLLEKSGDRMGFFDIHAYPGAADREAEVLLQAARSLGGANIPIIVGETTYGDPQYRHVMLNNYRAAFHGSPQELFFWPVHSMTSHCNFDVPQPYRLKGALGR